MHILFLQCRDDACRLRFPATAAEAAGLVCPRCRGPLAQVAVASKAEVAPAVVPRVALVALLDNIRSIHNVGSMFRTADGAGVSHLHLAGITATPEHPRLPKAALGAQESVPWSYCRNSIDAAGQLRDEGYELWALERHADPAQPSLFDVAAPGRPLALVVGNEKAGVDPGVLAQCDQVLSLPMGGRKSSLNVAVAFGIAVYHIRFVIQAAGIVRAGSTA